MAHVFISYSSRHRDLTEELAAFLGRCGLDVWWDRELVSRSPFDAQIQEQLRTAGCIVVIWTEGAVASEWVQIEARHAVAHDRLVAVRADELDPGRIPEEFRKHDAHKLTAEPDLLLKDVLAVREGRLLLEDKRETLPAADQRTPAALLQAKFGLVDMIGAEARIGDLADWARSTGTYAGRHRRAAGRLIHGPGGLGKTRLLIEAAERLRAAGWSAGFLARPPVGAGQERRDRYDTAVGHLIRGARDNGLFLVMDYAEGRDAEIAALAERIQALPVDDARPVRLVLLTRAAGTWWDTLVGNTVVGALFDAGSTQGDVLALAGIETRQQRLDLFVAAVQGFAQPLVDMGYIMPTAEPHIKRVEALERGEGFDRPLAIQMEALLYLAANKPGQNELGIAGQLDRIVELERQHWPKLVGELDGQAGRSPIRHMDRAVAQVTGVQGVQSVRAAEDLFMADARYPKRRGDRETVETLSETVVRIYGRPDGGVAHLEPDLVGEHLVAGTADPELIEGCVAWIAEQPEARQAALREQFVTVLQRASQPVHGPEAGKAAALIDYLIATAGAAFGPVMVKVMGDTPGAVFSRLAAKVETLDPETLTAVNFALPVQNVAWMEFSLRVAARYADLARNWKSTADAVDATGAPRDNPLNRAAAAFGKLGLRLSNLGRREDALKASQEAVDIYRVLAKDRPDAFLPDLAMSLSNLGIPLSDLGRREDALKVSQEAVDIFRALAKDRPDAFLPDLAAGLSNLGSRISELGRREEALKASQEAVGIRRALAKDRPDAFLLDLAACLNNLGRDLSSLGRREDALTASQEAVDIFRALAKDRPDAFLPDLAAGLSNLGSRISELGRREDALKASQEAVDIRRALAKDRPDAFLPGLAMGLTSHGRNLFILGRYEEALKASQEAVDIYRALAKDRPDAFLPDLAMSVNNIGPMLFNLGRHEEALKASQEAVDIRRALAKERPDAFLPDLAQSLGAISQTFATAGRNDEAGEAAREGLATIAPFVEAQPQAFGKLALALGQIHVQHCKNAGREPDAALLERVAKALGGGGGRG